jgi:hypothetical protein
MLRSPASSKGLTPSLEIFALAVLAFVYVLQRKKLPDGHRKGWIPSSASVPQLFVEVRSVLYVICKMNDRMNDCQPQAH